MAVPSTYSTEYRCSVPESHGASLTPQEEDAFWKEVSMVQPAQRREFELSTKYRKIRIEARRPLPTEREDHRQMAIANQYAGRSYGACQPAQRQAHSL